MQPNPLHSPAESFDKVLSNVSSIKPPNISRLVGSPCLNAMLCFLKVPGLLTCNNNIDEGLSLTMVATKWSQNAVY